jgi:uncharacterized membrane protein YgcG
LRAASLAGLLACLPVGFVAATAMAAGPPYPDPIVGVAVYDEAGVLSSDAEAELESRIDEIEAATGAEIVIYTQVKPESDTVAEAEADAVALGEQWGVGREGFDDGLVILLDLDESLCHGQAQLNAAVGFREAYLSNAARQRIYDERMLPRLRECDMDGAMLVAMEEIGAATIPERAAELNRARLVDAIIGIVIAGIVVIGFVGWMVLSWWRYGRDPKLADSDSIHIPAPPPELTPASAALVYDGVSSRRTLTTAMIDLASRGHIAFDEIEEGLLLKSKKVAILIGAPAPDDPEDEYERSQAQRTPISEAEQYALKELGDIAADGRIEPDDMLKFGSHVATFDKKLEAYAVKKGWFTRAPKEAVRRWRRWAVVVAVIGAVALIVGFNIPSGGLVSLGVGSLAAAIVGFVISGWMPARTKSGALTRIMLSAYRRTLEKTMAMARSMDQVVREAGLPWLDSPDRAVVWGVALGLHPQVEEVLKRTADDLGDGRVGVGSAYTPAWYGSFSTGGGSYSGGPGGSIMSSSAIPSFGGMMAVLGTIGNTPSSSGGGGFGGGGGFSGGGGGGGAGGGF